MWNTYCVCHCSNTCVTILAGITSMNCSIWCIKTSSEKSVFLKCPQTMTSLSYWSGAGWAVSDSNAQNSAWPMCDRHPLSWSFMMPSQKQIQGVYFHVLTWHSLCKYNLEHIFFSKHFLRPKQCDCVSPMQTDERITSANKSKTQNRRFMMPW